MMRIQTILILLLTACCLSACGDFFSITKRRYHSGYYLAGSGHRQPVDYNPKEDVLDEDKRDSTSTGGREKTMLSEKQADSSDHPAGFVIPEQPVYLAFANHRSEVAPSDTAVPGNKTKEEVLIRRAKLAAIGISGLMVASCLIWQVSRAMFLIFLGLIIVAAVIALFAAHDVKVMHRKKEKYHGRGILIWARIMAILSFPFVLIAKATDKSLNQ